MLKNERGSMLVDALLALVLVGFILLMLSSAYQAYVFALEKEKKGIDLYEVYETATRIYND